MKFFAAILLIAAVASAQPINIPSAASIIEQLLETIAAQKPEPIAVGPAIIESEYEPIAVGPAIVDALEGISVGPALIDFPLPESAVAEEPAIVPSPVSIVHGPVADVATDSVSLVQIIVNINQAAAESSPIAVAPVVVPETIQPTPVHVVEVAPEPVQVVEAPVEPVHVVEIAPEPVQVIETAPLPVEPVVIGIPIIPEAAVVLPEELN